MKADKSLTPDAGELARQANRLRRDVIEMAFRAGSGHCGGSLSSAEIVTCLYFGGILRIRPAAPGWEERDRFILSKGHAAPLLYAALARRGYFPVEELWTLRQLHSKLQGHPDMRKTPGVDMTTGSLGMGLSNGIGMAVAARLRGTHSRTFVLLGDGELDEGQVWEAAMLGVKLRLSNLVAVVDRNHVQLDGTNDAVMPLGNLCGKFQAFGWETVACDGHDCAALLETFGRACAAGSPVVIIAETVKGKGVSFMEGDHRWHGKPLDKETYELAKEELQECGS